MSRPVSTYTTLLVERLNKKSGTGPVLWKLNSPNAPLIHLDFVNDQWILKGGPSLKNWAEKQKASTTPTLLFFSAKDSKALPQFREILKKTKAWDNLIFCSRFDGLLKDLRELEPQWTFCSGEIFMTRLLALSSIGLAPMLEISADILFIHITTTLANSDIQKLVTEGHRQNKLVFIGPVTRPLESVRADGWMVISEDQKVE